MPVKLIRFTILLTLFVIVLGAYTRLSDAGLGCPDWPGCYGKLYVDESALEVDKAWIEMIHRYCASILGLCIIFICAKAFKKTPFVSLALLGLLIFQALLGMWTVTLKLYPMVVMGHLLGGFSILSSLWWINLRHNKKINIISNYKLSYKFRNSNFYTKLAALACIILALQIALGAWTSANYAALVCPDFPHCQGKLWPEMSWVDAFSISKVGIMDSPGVVLENSARVTIQMAHRIGALITSLIIIFLSISAIRNKYFANKLIPAVAILLLSVQIALGITNVLARLPMHTALLHNAIAAILFLTLLRIYYQTKYVYRLPNTL